MAGLALSASGLGSVLGGMVLAARFDYLPLAARYRRALMLFFAAFCLPLLAFSNLTLIILLFAAGFPFSLAYGTAGSLVAVISPDGSQAEAFSLIGSAMAAGASLGAAAAALVTTIPPLQRKIGLQPT